VDYIISTRSCRSEHPYGVNLRNTIFENIYYAGGDNSQFVAFDFALNTKVCALDNVAIRNAFLGECAQVLNMQHDGELNLTNVHADGLKDKMFVKKGAVVILDGKKIS
jgi:hypothetical protein